MALCGNGLSLYRTIPEVIMSLTMKGFENSIRKGENAGNSGQCFTQKQNSFPTREFPESFVICQITIIICKNC